ncbi:MAG TPA: glycosyltransferase family 39 protein [Thermoleophilaceae bacterium]|nr:glycosyltransferase family 39 protein [Thermoleophilaceae bacterium]
MASLALARRRLAGARLPVTPLASAGLVAALVLVSLLLRSRGLGGPFWIDEGLSVGISSFPFFEIPSILRFDGSPPLYYLLLHVWMELFGRSEGATHVLSLIFALASIPVGLWAGWSLFGPRAGWFCAGLFALNPFLTAYSHETRMYSLMVLLGLVATAAFVHAFVLDRRRFAIVFGVALALMLYTHNWAIFFIGASGAALIGLAHQRSEQRGSILRHGGLAFGTAILVWLPWVPTLAFQITHTGAPWANVPTLGDIQSGMGAVVGGLGPAIGLLLVAGTGVSHIVRRRRSIERLEMLTLAGLGIGTLLLAWGASQISPAWAFRYLAVVVGPLMLLTGVGLARARRQGVAALALVALLWLPQGVSPEPATSERSVTDEVEPLLDRGDLVVSTHPERTTVLDYYLPRGVRYMTSLGPVEDPRYMDWRDALGRLEEARASKTIGPTLDRLDTGRDILLVRPVTEISDQWKAPWTELVRKRSAQWARLLREDSRFVRRAVAPDGPTPAESGVRATLYTKVND